jgi:hypothetical protein
MRTQSKCRCSSEGSSEGSSDCSSEGSSEGSSWFGFCSSAILLFVAFSSTLAAGRVDGFVSRTGLGGAGIFSQNFEISKHFVKPDQNDGNFLLSRRDQSLARAKEIEYLPLSWAFGGGYCLINSPALGTAPAIVDGVISIKGGLAWTPVPSIDLSLDVNIDNIAAESYNHGALLIQSWKTFLLHPKPQAGPPADYDNSEADQYFERQLQEKVKALALKKETKTSEGEVMPEVAEEFEQQFPAIQVGLILGFAEHLTGGKVYRNTSLGSLDSDQRLYQNRTGVELIYLKRKGLAYRAGGNVFFYSIPVDTYLPYLEMGTLQRLPLSASTGLSASANQMLAFPHLSFDQSFEFEVNDREKFQIFLNETVYSSTQQGPLVSATASYTRALGKSWKFSIEPFVGVILTGGALASGMIQFSYDF